MLHLPRLSFGAGALRTAPQGISRNAIAPLLMGLEKSGLISRRYRRIEILDLRSLTALSKQARPSRIVDSYS